MTATLTYADTLGKHNIPLPDDLLADVEVPVLTGPQRQGDVGVWPRRRPSSAELDAYQPVPPAGVAVVRGEAATGGNAHILDAYDGTVLWRPATGRDSSLSLGVLHVPDGAVAYLTHTEEHGSNGIGPGTYRLTGKREQAEELRRVAD